jgi:molybdopterin-containing oxidoreductase family membrane subunit
MLEKALGGGKLYWGWMTFLLVVFIVGFKYYLRQFDAGMALTGLGREVSYGLYASQFMFFAGVSASTIAVTAAHHLQIGKTPGRVAVLAEFLSAVSAIISVVFLIANLGQPTRLLNLLFYPAFNSPLFWVLTAMTINFALNISIGWAALHAQYKDVTPPDWIVLAVYVSIPCALSIPIFISFMYSTAAGTSTAVYAITAARYLASSFAGGLLHLYVFCFALKTVSKYDLGEGALKTLGTYAVIALVLNFVFMAMQMVTMPGTALTFFAGGTLSAHPMASQLYSPTYIEGSVVHGIWAMGLMILTVLYRVTVAVRAKA